MRSRPKSTRRIARKSGVGCNALNPLQGIATVEIEIRYRASSSGVATHSIPFRGLQRVVLDKGLERCSQPLQRTQSPSGDCNGRRRNDAGLRPQSGTLQRTQSPSGDCNTKSASPTTSDRPTRCNALNPLQGIATQLSSKRGIVTLATRCNALNPLQGIATQSARPHCPRTSSRTCCNALNPLQGIATGLLQPSSAACRTSWLQRTQSPSGDCNLYLLRSLRNPNRRVDPLQRTQSPSGDCNA